MDDSNATSNDDLHDPDSEGHDGAELTSTETASTADKPTPDDAIVINVPIKVR